MMPPELSPLALWGFPLLIAVLFGVIKSHLISQDKKLEALMLYKVDCVREFASKKQVEDLETQVGGMSRKLAKLEGKIDSKGGC